MHTLEATPYCLTHSLGMSNDEYNMLAAALQYTLNHVLYDTKNDTYYLHEHLPWKSCTVMQPEEFDVLEGIAFRVMGDLLGRDEQ